VSTDLPFDRRLRRVRRNRAAPRFGEAAFLHHHVAEGLIDRLEDVRRGFAEALEIGAADGHLAGLLRSRGIAVTTTDHGHRFPGVDIVCDEDRLPFADHSFDLVVSIGVLDSVNDLPGSLMLIRRILRPGGLLLAAFAGAGSLPRLRAAMLASDEAANAAAPRIHPQIDLRAAGDLLQRAGFVLPVADVESVPVRYASLDRLVADLRATGGTNLLHARATQPIRRAGFAAARSAFGTRVEERFEILHLTAWAP